MTNNIIEPVAKRVFDGYYRHCAESSLEDLQYLTEEAYKLHERLRKQPGYRTGLHGFDEFLLLKALRNYSVHQGEFIGEAYRIKRKFAEYLKLDLQRVCLIKKEIVNKAISHEPRLKNDADEQSKVKAIRSQLVEFGDYYNLEPVIYNFMVKLYELLTRQNISILGTGFQELDTSYKRETYYRYKHYVPLSPVNVDSKTLIANLIPITEPPEPETGLPDIDEDRWKNISTLNIDCSSYEPINYVGDDYQLFLISALQILTRAKESYAVAMATPQHIGIALINDGSTGQITGFNINQQITVLKQAGIELDEAYLDVGPDELLVLSFVEGTQLWPVVISKHDLHELWQHKKSIEHAMGTKPVT